MKLKYLIKCEDRYLLATCLVDLANYYNVTLSGMRYKNKHKLVDLIKHNVELHNILKNKYEYSIDKFGVVTIMAKDVDTLE